MSAVQSSDADWQRWVSREGALKQYYKDSEATDRSTRLLYPELNKAVAALRKLIGDKVLAAIPPPKCS